jgi:dolichol kinase
MKKEITRKTIHIIFGSLFLVLIYFAGTQLSTIIIGLCLIAGTLISIGITRGHKFPFLEKIVKRVERENEKTFPGKAAVLFFISAIILLLIFKNNSSIIMAALSVQVFGDSAAALIGKKFGKHKIFKEKTLEGSTACLLVAIICISFFFPIQIAIIAGVIATIVELLPLDDNLFVPLLTALVIKILI